MDAAARGAHRGLHHRRKMRRAARLALTLKNARRRLRQVETREQAAEAGLAVRGAVAFKRRQRDGDAALEPILHLREQKSLLMRRQQHVEAAACNQSLDKGEEA